MELTLVTVTVVIGSSYCSYCDSGDGGAYFTYCDSCDRGCFFSFCDGVDRLILLQLL